MRVLVVDEAKLADYLHAAWARRDTSQASPAATARDDVEDRVRGFGLAIVELIARAHGRDAPVANRDGDTPGSRFAASMTRFVPDRRPIRRSCPLNPSSTRPYRRLISSWQTGVGPNMKRRIFTPARGAREVCRAQAAAPADWRPDHRGGRALGRLRGRRRELDARTKGRPAASPCRPIRNDARAGVGSYRGCACAAHGRHSRRQLRLPPWPRRPRRRERRFVSVALASLRLPDPTPRAMRTAATPRGFAQELARALAGIAGERPLTRAAVVQLQTKER